MFRVLYLLLPHSVTSTGDTKTSKCGGTVQYVVANLLVCVHPSPFSSSCLSVISDEVL